MTVSQQLKQTVAGLKSAVGSLEQFALQTQDQNAKNIYTTASQQAQQIVSSLEPRVKEIEKEEPQYKGF